jgi:hypothetical protein
MRPVARVQMGFVLIVLTLAGAAASSGAIASPRTWNVLRNVRAIGRTEGCYQDGCVGRDPEREGCSADADLLRQERVRWHPCR